MSTFPVDAGPMQTWVDQHAIGFGEIPFQIVGSAQWMPTGRVVEFEIPGSNRVETQFMGLGAWKVDYQLNLASIADYTALCLAQGTEAILTVFADTIAVPHDTLIIAGVRYDRVMATLSKVSGPRWQRGMARCTASFSVPVES